MTHSQENNMKEQKPLTENELEKISVLFHRMSTSAKHAFLAMAIIKFSHNYEQIIDKLGEEYEKCIIRA